MKKYTEPKISLLAYVEEDIITTSVIEATKVEDTTDISSDSSVSLSMSNIIKLGE